MSSWALWGIIVGIIVFVPGAVVFVKWGYYCDGEWIGSGKYAYCLGDDVNPNTVERNAGISLLGIGVVLILVCGTYTKVQFWRNRWARRKRDAEASAHSFTYNHVNTDANDYDYSATAT
jgi:hypothetical protein